MSSISFPLVGVASGLLRRDGKKEQEPPKAVIFEVDKQSEHAEVVGDVFEANSPSLQGQSDRIEYVSIGEEPGESFFEKAREKIGERFGIARDNLSRLFGGNDEPPPKTAVEQVNEFIEGSVAGSLKGTTETLRHLNRDDDVRVINMSFGHSENRVEEGLVKLFQENPELAREFFTSEEFREFAPLPPQGQGVPMGGMLGGLAGGLPPGENPPPPPAGGMFGGMAGGLPPGENALPPAGGIFGGLGMMGPGGELPKTSLTRYIENQVDTNGTIQKAFSDYREQTRIAAENDKFLVVATGNWREQGIFQKDEFNFFAQSDHVISVAASDSKGTPEFGDDTIADFSSRGNGEFNPTLAAPGVNIMGSNGTSLAAPAVAGTIQEMLAANPDLTFDEVRIILQNTAYDSPADERNEGAGLLDANRAIEEARGSNPFAVASN